MPPARIAAGIAALAPCSPACGSAPAFLRVARLESHPVEGGVAPGRRPSVLPTSLEALERDAHCRPGPVLVPVMLGTLVAPVVSCCTAQVVVLRVAVDGVRTKDLATPVVQSPRPVEVSALKG